MMALPCCLALNAFPPFMCVVIVFIQNHVQPVDVMLISSFHGCNASEILKHISRSCYATHGLRIIRYNALRGYFARSLEQRGYSVHHEAIFKVNNKKFKADLEAYSSDRIPVIDAQVIND